MSLSCQKSNFKISRVTIDFYGIEDNKVENHTHFSISLEWIFLQKVKKCWAEYILLTSLNALNILIMIYLKSLRKFNMEVTWCEMFEWNLEMFVGLLKAGISYQLSQRMVSSIFPWEIMPCNDHVKQITTLMKSWIRQRKKCVTTVYEWTHKCYWSFNY